jgi:hypothetical protein
MPGKGLPEPGKGLPELGKGLPELGKGLPELGKGVPEPGKEPALRLALSLPKGGQVCLAYRRVYRSMAKALMHFKLRSLIHPFALYH